MPNLTAHHSRENPPSVPTCAPAGHQPAPGKTIPDHALVDGENGGPGPFPVLQPGATLDHAERWKNILVPLIAVATTALTAIAAIIEAAR